MESPKRKLQKKNDYQRHKLFRKIKRRRKAQAEAEQHVAEKQLRRKLKLPKFGDGKEKINLDNAHFDKEGNLVDNTTGIKYIPISDDVVITPNTKYFYDPYASANNYFDPIKFANLSNINRDMYYYCIQGISYNLDALSDLLDKKLNENNGAEQFQSSLPLPIPIIEPVAMFIGITTLSPFLADMAPLRTILDSISI